MTDKQTTKWNLQTWLSETKTYPSGAAYSRKEIFFNFNLCLAALPLIAISGMIVMERAIDGLASQSVVFIAGNTIKLAIIRLLW